MNRILKFPCFLLLLLLQAATLSTAHAQTFRALVLTERGGIHEPYVVAGLSWLDSLAAVHHFTFDVINDTEKINDAYLAQYQVFIQLNYPPYTWTKTAATAFEKYIADGKGGWVGFHHATLLGEFDGYPLWNWFSGFMGGIRWKNYVARLVSGRVTVEDKKHPAMQDLPATFVIDKEEWYTYDKNPRPNVHVLASVDESTYTPKTDTTMGDHPVIWTNPAMKARNIYILMGHHPSLFRNPAYNVLVRNAILWAAGKKTRKS
jgi:type 1 glutamine amidotransferase